MLFDATINHVFFTLFPNCLVSIEKNNWYLGIDILPSFLLNSLFNSLLILLNFPRSHSCHQWTVKILFHHFQIYFTFFPCLLAGARIQCCSWYKRESFQHLTTKYDVDSKYCVEYLLSSFRLLLQNTPDWVIYKQ